MYIGTTPCSLLVPQARSAMSGLANEAAMRTLNALRKACLMNPYQLGLLMKVMPGIVMRLSINLNIPRKVCVMNLDHLGLLNEGDA